MLKIISLTGSVIASLGSSAFAVTIASWSFESPNPADATNFAIYPNSILATVGTGNAGGTHASAGADWTTPVGNGSTDSFSVNEWAGGDYFQFLVSTVGFTPIFVSFSQISSNTGPRDFVLQYSSSGISGTFTNHAPYVVLANAAPNSWGSLTPIPAAFYSFDLTGVAALSNNSDVVFRLVNTSNTSANGGTVVNTGTDRVDNFTVSDVAVPPPVGVPEPTAIIGLLSGSALISARRRRMN